MEPSCWRLGTNCRPGEEDGEGVDDDADVGDGEVDDDTDASGGEHLDDNTDVSGGEDKPNLFHRDRQNSTEIFV